MNLSSISRKIDLKQGCYDFRLETDSKIYERQNFVHLCQVIELQIFNLCLLFITSKEQAYFDDPNIHLRDITCMTLVIDMTST